jgi:hypothetical protein
MASWDLAAESRARMEESRQRMDASHALIAAALFRVTRRSRIDGGSDVHDPGFEPPIVCVLCKKPIVKLKQNSMTINERAYHTDCWERQKTRRARS